MDVALHICPRCGEADRVPFAGVTPGDAGIWVCDRCDAVYQIDITFSLINPRKPPVDAHPSSLASALSRS